MVSPQVPESKRRRLVEAVRAFRRRERQRRAKRRMGAVRDTVGGIVITIVMLVSLYVASDGSWPPMLVIESESMMHLDEETPYGKFGTLDVGDVLFVRAIDSPDEVRTWADGGPERYGRPGDVIVFYPNGNREATPVVHRAMAWVEVEWLDGGAIRYEVEWLDGETLVFDGRGIYVPALNLDESTGFSRANGFRPQYSGFLTKGDNPISNPAPDQAYGTNVTALVAPGWIEGKVYGEIPWLGLGRLAFLVGETNPQPLRSTGWSRVGNGFAPTELWTCFFVVVALVLLIPLSWDTYKMWREHRARRRQMLAEEAEAERRLAEERARLEAERQRKERERAERRARRGGAPVEFEPI